MRTPGRCSNIEGCWISASHRDVWLNVGEDFTCPNCGGMLSAPPGRAVQARGMKKAAATATAAAMGIAAVAVATVKLSTLSLTVHPALTAMLNAPSAMISAAFRRPPELLASLQPRPAPDAPPSPVPFMRPVAASRPADAGSRPADAPAPVPLYVAHNQAPAFVPNKAATQVAAIATVATAVAPAKPPVHVAEAPPPAPFITFVSEAAFVLPPQAKQRPIVLPISFGQPPGPETDAAPVDHRWRYHGLGHTRHTGFLPAPALANDAISEIRTTSELR
jgi:hypothetical protein